MKLRDIMWKIVYDKAGREGGEVRPSSLWGGRHAFSSLLFCSHLSESGTTSAAGGWRIRMVLIMTDVFPMNSPWCLVQGHHIPHYSEVPVRWD